MLLLSFKEYVSAFDNNNYQQLFLDYMRNGGMPGNINILKSKFQSHTLIFISHRVSEVQGIVNRVIEMDLGNIIKDSEV